MPTLDAESCAALLKCSKAHLHRLVREGAFPGTKVGRGWVFLEEDVMTWLKARLRPKPVAPPGKPGRPRKRVVTTVC